MEDLFKLVTQSAGGGLTAALEDVNAVTCRFGLSLTAKQLYALDNRRREALKGNGRVEFGGDIVKKLITAFCDSPYIDQENYEETMLELVDAFYYFKNESADLFGDDELIGLMRGYFDTDCQGSLEYLTGTTLEALCRQARNEGL